MQAKEDRTLYVVATRPETSEPYRELTAEEIAAGWDDYHDRSRVWRRGHDTGRLHSLVAAHVLTWNPQPGDVILARLTVHFLESFDADADGECCGRRTTSASYEPTAANGQVTIQCDTVLGRPVMLGEDGAEDAFGRDAIYEQVAHAVLNDWRDSPCAYWAKKVVTDAEIDGIPFVRITREEAKNVCLDTP